MKWSEFAAAAPEIARFAEERMTATGLVLLGTLRADGWPRISPIEPEIVDGHLIVGGTRDTRKTLDLVRDPRCTLNTVTRNKDATEGEVKLFGRAVEITEPELLDRIGDDVVEQYGFRPGPRTYHNCWMDISSAAYLVYHGDLTDMMKTWRAGEEVVEVERRWTPDGYKIMSPPE